MRIIIGGAGRVGIELARALGVEGYDIVIMDQDSRAVSNAQGLDCLVIRGDITSREKLIEAGIVEASVFVAATPSDEHNLIACSIAEHAHSSGESKHSLTNICRLRNSVYIDEYRNGNLKDWAKVDYIVNPLAGAIQRLNAGLRSTDIEEVIPFNDEAYVIELEVGETAHTVTNRTLDELAEDMVHGMPSVVGLKRKNQRSIIPKGDTKLEKGDRIAVATIGLESFNPALIMFGHELSYFPDVPKVVIIGATAIGNKMAAEWLEHGAWVTVLERDLHRANELAGSQIGANPNLEIIHGDHLDRTILTEIGIDKHDVAVSALDNDHENIAAVLLASDMGVERTGLMLYDADLVKVTQRMGISFAVDRRRVAVDNMLTHIHEKLSGRFALLSEIPNVVGLTFEVTEKAKFAGKTVGEAQFPESVKLAFIKRLNLAGEWETTKPTDDHVLLENDLVILFCLQDKIPDAEKLFRV
ncbi:MAG TPA: NAD-binding protein [Candidatus Poseidoniaceae archaeon]|nr:NAD-binding protein [Candidatus Poseidoniaceae archaeon]